MHLCILRSGYKKYEAEGTRERFPSFFLIAFVNTSDAGVTLV